MPQTPQTKRYGVFAKFAKINKKKHPGIHQEDLIAFFEHLSTLLSSSVPLLRALTLAAEQTESLKFQKILTDITKKVAGGGSLYEAIASYPKLFPYQWAQVIRTGEQSGQLAPLLIKLNESIKKSTDMANKVKSALIYPAVMACVAAAAIFIMLWKVIPTFAQMFNDMGKQLPAITRFVLGISNFVQHYGIAIVICATILFFVTKKFVSTTYGARQMYSFIFAIPVAGELQLQSAQERFCANIALLLNSGMPLLEALESTKESFRENPIYYDILTEVYNRVSVGNDLGGSLAISGYFTNMTVGMVKMGEESGTLAAVLQTVANYYDDKVSVLTMRLTAMMEPVIVIGMGIVVSLMLGSVYLPMFDMSSGS